MLRLCSTAQQSPLLRIEPLPDGGQACPQGSIEDYGAGESDPCLLGNLPSAVSCESRAKKRVPCRTGADVPTLAVRTPLRERTRGTRLITYMRREVHHHDRRPWAVVGTSRTVCTRRASQQLARALPGIAPSRRLGLSRAVHARHAALESGGPGHPRQGPDGISPPGAGNPGPPPESARDDALPGARPGGPGGGRPAAV